MVHSLSTHASLLARLKTGSDDSAWAEFTARYRDLIRGYALRRGLQTADAEDLVQDVFLALSSGMKDFVYDPQKGRFRGFLKTIAVRAIGKRLRKSRGMVAQSAAELVLDSTPQEHDDDADWEAEWRQYHLRAAMLRVRSEFRASDLLAFELLTRDGKDAKGVAQELGISVDSAYQAKSRILKRLKALVTEQVAEEG